MTSWLVRWCSILSPKKGERASRSGYVGTVSGVRRPDRRWGRRASWHHLVKMGEGFMLEVKVWVLLVGVSVVGTLATLAYYYLGKQGYEAVLERFPQVKREQWDRVHSLYDRHGSVLLFLSSVPVIGILFTTAAGAFGIQILAFVLWVLVGRMTRNVLVVVLFDQALGFLLAR